MPFSHKTSQKSAKKQTKSLTSSSRQNKALTQAIEERRRLKAMEQSAPEPISKTAAHRGRLVEQRIDRLRQQVNKTKKGNERS